MVKTFKKTEWGRVTKQNPCPICKKPDYCTFSEGVACCMRVQSSKPMKNGGWLHKLGGDIPKYIPIVTPNSKPHLNFEFVHNFLVSRTTDKMLRGLADNLGVEAIAMKYLGASWDFESQAWGFPMRDAQRKVIGIRLRAMDGKKWSVAGSRSGLFIPDIPTEGSRQLFVGEGPTDCAALLSLGFMAISRPSCLGSEELVNEFIRKEKIREVVLISDNDENGAGLRGAEKLQATLKVKSVLVIPPAKDVREFLKLGGTMEAIKSMIRDLIWTVPRGTKPFSNDDKFS